MVNDPVNGEDYTLMFGSGLWNDTDNQAHDQAPLHGVVEIPFVIPEPSTAFLVGLGLVGFGAIRRRG